MRRFWAAGILLLVNVVVSLLVVNSEEPDDQNIFF